MRTYLRFDTRMVNVILWSGSLCYAVGTSTDWVLGILVGGIAVLTLGVWEHRPPRWSWWCADGGTVCGLVGGSLAWLASGKLAIGCFVGTAFYLIGAAYLTSLLLALYCCARGKDLDGTPL